MQLIDQDKQSIKRSVIEERKSEIDMDKLFRMKQQA